MCVCVCVCVYLLIIRNRHVDEMNSIQYNRIDTQCAWRRRSLPFLFLSSRSRSLFLYGWEHNRAEKNFFFSFGEKYKHWIRIISPFNSSTWLIVCYSKGVSMYCSLSLSLFLSFSSNSSSRVRYIQANDRFRSFPPFLPERNEEKEREEFSLSLSFSLSLRQYAAIRYNCYFDWRIRSPVQPIISLVKKEKFISIFYCLLLFFQLRWSSLHP